MVLKIILLIIECNVMIKQPRWRYVIVQFCLQATTPTQQFNCGSMSKRQFLWPSHDHRERVKSLKVCLHVLSQVFSVTLDGLIQTRGTIGSVLRTFGLQYVTVFILVHSKRHYKCTFCGVFPPYSSSLADMFLCPAEIMCFTVKLNRETFVYLNFFLIIRDIAATLKHKNFAFAKTELTGKTSLQK